MASLCVPRQGKGKGAPYGPRALDHDVHDIDLTRAALRCKLNFYIMPLGYREGGCRYVMPWGICCSFVMPRKGCGVAYSPHADRALASVQLMLRMCRDGWPQSFWDDWIRDNSTRKGRHCIRPELGFSSNRCESAEVAVSPQSLYATASF